MTVSWKSEGEEVGGPLLRSRVSPIYTGEYRFNPIIVIGHIHVLKKVTTFERSPYIVHRNCMTKHT